MEFGKPVLHILLLDDDEEDYMIIHEMLDIENGYHFDLTWFQVCETPEETAAIICSGEYDVTILDYEPSKVNRKELFTLLNERCPAASLIILTAWQGPEIEHLAGDIAPRKNWTYLHAGQLETHLLIDTIRHVLQR